MATPDQIAANRLTVLKSAGPRTAAGKLALRHGVLSSAILVRDEDQAEFDDFQQAMLADLRPVGPVEYLLAERVVAAAWRLGCAARVEAGLLDARAYERIAANARAVATKIKAAADPRARRFKKQCNLKDRYHLKPLEPELDAVEGLRSDSVTFGKSFADASAELHTLLRYEITIERGMYRALHELQRLQAARAGEPVPPPQVLDVAVTANDFCETNPIRPDSAYHSSGLIEALDASSAKFREEEARREAEALLVGTG